MEYVLYTIFFLSCLLLMVTILLQPGKTDAGALFTSNISSNAFGPRGTATVLSKITIITATIFMVSALLLSMPALRGNVSVLSSNPEAPADNTSVNSNVSTNAPAANVDVNAASNVAPASNANAATNGSNTNK